MNGSDVEPSAAPSGGYSDGGDIDRNFGGQSAVRRAMMSVMHVTSRRDEAPGIGQGPTST